jgi:hypothetical protein
METATLQTYPATAQRVAPVRSSSPASFNRSVSPSDSASSATASQSAAQLLLADPQAPAIAALGKCEPWAHRMLIAGFGSIGRVSSPFSSVGVAASVVVWLRCEVSLCFCLWFCAPWIPRPGCAVPILITHSLFGVDSSMLSVIPGSREGWLGIRASCRCSCVTSKCPRVR